MAAANQKRDTRGDATRLMILGHLRERRAHGYEIQQWMRAQQMDRWSTVLPGSVYHALKRMEREGLVEAVAEERTGDRLRKVYAITRDGERALLAIVRRLLARQPHPTRSDFALAVGWLDALPPEEAVRILEANVRRLEQARELWETGRAIKEKYGMPAVATAAFDNARQVLDADIAFVRTLIRLVQEGRTGLREAREALAHTPGFGGLWSTEAGAADPGKLEEPGEGE